VRPNVILGCEWLVKAKKNENRWFFKTCNSPRNAVPNLLTPVFNHEPSEQISLLNFGEKFHTCTIWEENVPFYCTRHLLFYLLRTCFINYIGFGNVLSVPHLLYLCFFLVLALWSPASVGPWDPTRAWAQQEQGTRWDHQMVKSGLEHTTHRPSPYLAPNITITTQCQRSKHSQNGYKISIWSPLLANIHTTSYTLSKFSSFKCYRKTR